MNSLNSIEFIQLYSIYLYFVADVTGKIRIWDTVNPEHITKNEFQPFAGLVKDLDWSADSQRIVAGGQGREKYESLAMSVLDIGC